MSDRSPFLGQLQALGYGSYEDYLRSPHWPSLRKQAARELVYICVCGADRHLHLHHMAYARLGHERLADLRWLCERCHHMVHDLERKGLTDLAMTGMVSTERAKITAPLRQAVSARQHADWKAARAERTAPPDRSGLDICERLGLARREARQYRIDISSQLRVIERTLDRINKQLAAA
jgi:hypothetical protein